MKLKNKNVLVIGLAKSGQSACEFLVKHHSKVFAYDKDQDKKVFSCDVKRVEKIDEEFLKQMHLIVISPGVSIYNSSVKLAKMLGIKVIGELELGLNYAKGKKIMITGSNGKTTTVNMIEQTFNYAKKSNLLVGNVGNPITKYVSPFKTCYICEVSSFQLESSSVKPNIACILNLSENHLDRHFSVNEYFETKFKIFENMTKNGTLILNYDDENLKKLESKNVDILGKKCFIKPKIKWISLKAEVDGAFVKDNKICFKHNNKTEIIDDISNVKILGEHNLYNILAMVAVCKTCHIKNKYICSTIQNFAGIEHRLEFVCSIDGVEYINDSKSSTPQATITALNAIKKPIVLILGGSSKGLNYDDFALKIKNKFKFAVLTGEISTEIEKSFQKADIKNYQIQKNFADAVKLASKKATKNDVVLLSPATASFDQFENFEQRGECFKKIVSKIDEK